VGQRGAAGAEHHLVGDVDVQLGLQRGVDVDLGQDAEPLLGQGCADGGQDRLERLVERVLSV